MFRTINALDVSVANDRRNGFGPELSNAIIQGKLPLVEVTELPRATLEEREVLLDLGIIDNTGVLNNDY